MDIALLDQAEELLEKANAELEPELLEAEDARRVMAAYARIERLGAFGVAATARKVNDAATVSKVTGTSMGKAKETVATAAVMGSSVELAVAMQHGEVASIRQLTSPRRKSHSLGLPQTSSRSPRPRVSTCSRKRPAR